MHVTNIMSVHLTTFVQDADKSYRNSPWPLYTVEICQSLGNTSLPRYRYGKNPNFCYHAWVVISLDFFLWLFWLLGSPSVCLHMDPQCICIWIFSSLSVIIWTWSKVVWTTFVAQVVLWLPLAGSSVLRFLHINLQIHWFGGSIHIGCIGLSFLHC